MITALEAKQKVFRARSYYELVANRINKEASKGADMCKIHVDELPLVKSKVTLCEIARFLTEFGYHTTIVDETLSIYWYPIKPYYLYEDGTSEEE